MEIISGDVRIRDLGNEISDAVHKALEQGLDVDVVCSALVGVAADYWMVSYDPKSVLGLADIIRAKSKRPNLGSAGGQA